MTQMNSREEKINNPGGGNLKEGGTFDKIEVLLENEQKLVESMIDNTESIDGLMSTLRQLGKVKLGNNVKMDCYKWAETIKKVTHDIRSEKINVQEGCLYITSKVNLRENYLRLIKEVMEKQEEQKKLIKEADSFEGLYKVLEEVREIYSKNHEVPVDKWISKIIDLRNHVKIMHINIDDEPDVLMVITSTMGLRDKVAELLRKENNL